VGIPTGVMDLHGCGTRTGAAARAPSERSGDEDTRAAVLPLQLAIEAVTVDFEYTGAAVDPYGNQRVGFEGTTTINRKEWGVNWNAALEAGGVLVSEKVVLEFEVSAIRTADAA